MRRLILARAAWRPARADGGGGGGGGDGGGAQCGMAPATVVMAGDGGGIGNRAVERNGGDGGKNHSRSNGACIYRHTPTHYISLSVANTTKSQRA